MALPKYYFDVDNRAPLRHNGRLFFIQQQKVNNYEKLLITDLNSNNHAKIAQKTIIKYDFERDDFISSVKKIKKYISSGDVMQVVLSQRMTIDFPEKPIDFYRELRKINPSPYMYYLNMGEYTVVGSSPEI